MNMVAYLSANLSLLLHAVTHLFKFPSNGKAGKKGEDERTQTKLGEASFVSRLTFSWINQLLHLGYSKPLALEDIPTLLQEDEANQVYKTFSSTWDSQARDFNSKNGNNLLLQTLLKMQWKEMIFIGICAFLRTLAVVASPLLLYASVQYTKNEHKHRSEGLILVGCLVSLKFMESLSQRHWYFNSRRCGMRMRSAVMVAVYQKQLKLSSLGRRRHSTGEIMNYIGVDAYRLGDALWWCHMAWSLVLQLFLAIGILFKVVGLGALPGLFPILVISFLNVPFAKIFNKYHSRFTVAQDERLRGTMEVLNNMKIIKLQSWEDKFKEMIDKLRGAEYNCLAKSQLIKSSTAVLYWMSPTIAAAVVFIGCMLTRSAPLNAATIFTALATLRSMSEPVRWIPEALSVLIQVQGVIKSSQFFPARG